MPATSFPVNEKLIRQGHACIYTWYDNHSLGKELDVCLGRQGKKARAVVGEEPHGGTAAPQTK
jgi:hypothetical protein